MQDPRSIILRRKQELGERLVILGHHYQSEAVIEFADFKGDSLELARRVPDLAAAEYIVFCGVYFMAETAAILAPDRKVLIPDVTAGCPMADMAGLPAVEQAWRELGGVLDPAGLLPVTYVNSTADIKAFCGRHGGAVCTSGNARTLLPKLFAEHERLFFMPDKNLGHNIGLELGLSPEQIVLWQPGQTLGGLDPVQIEKARLILWNGWCHVHWPSFAVSDIERLRSEIPGVKVIVHLESDPATVAASDAAGSTAEIIKYVAELPAGATVAIGTEFNLVKRLMDLHAGRVKVMPLKMKHCLNMAKITTQNLAETLEDLDNPLRRVTVPEPTAGQAREALRRMLR
jgi:quinolinate synthase